MEPAMPFERSMSNPVMQHTRRHSLPLTGILRGRSVPNNIRDALHTPPLPSSRRLSLESPPRPPSALAAHAGANPARTPPLRPILRPRRDLTSPAPPPRGGTYGVPHRQAPGRHKGCLVDVDALSLSDENLTPRIEESRRCHVPLFMHDSWDATTPFETTSPTHPMVLAARRLPHL
mmetsp:Transcript_59656/g.136357  ORF Transcript_59656/g.136357 Transcript_59656/m.136357 type:complete len:176 (+) Transcript_59656:470-997(+)